MSRITVIKGDITEQRVDAIVNAANASLMGGGGVDGAIHRAGGPEIKEACKKIIAKIERLDTGKAVITTAGNLPAKYVIHTVGPVWKGGDNGEPKLLANCYTNSLRLAIANNCKTIAFPNISTGIYGYPKPDAADAAVNSILQFLDGNSSIEKVLLVCFDDENEKLVSKALENV